LNREPARGVYNALQIPQLDLRGLLLREDGRGWEGKGREGREERRQGTCSKVLGG